MCAGSMFPSISIAALLLTPPGTPAGGFHWQRIITPPPGAGTQHACVVLDAATNANAAPALRDLRLFQDGTELPYVIEESYDERALNSGVTSDDDRSEYEVVSVIPLSRVGIGAVAGALPSGATGYQGSARVLAHVPVERVRLEPAPTWPTSLQLTASTLPNTTHVGAVAPRAEVVQTLLLPQRATWAVTLGANLQSAADLQVNIPVAPPTLQRVFLEMRRRSLCYQPRSAAPLVLYLGSGQGIAAKVYGLSNGFSVSADRPYATMGPLEPNPDLQHATLHPVSRLLIAIAVLGGALLLTAGIGLELLRKERGRPKAAHPA